jgi:hypothetical protein
MDCTYLNDQCGVGVCNEAANACEYQPAYEGQACDDGLFCTTGETCSVGVCGGGGPRDCSGAGDQCNAGICDEVSDSCVADPLTDGTACDNGDACPGDSCLGGVCVAASCGPTAPTGLTAKSLRKSVRLTWNANPEPDLDGYRVYRSVTSGGPYTFIASRRSNQPRYSDSSPLTGPSCYVVTATNLGGQESGYSNEVCLVRTQSHKKKSDRLTGLFR